MMPVNCFVTKKNDILTLASLYNNTHKKKRKGENKLVYTFYELCWFFLIYSFAGWCAGVVANAVRNRKFVNTGFMNMPFCLSYGVCAVLCCIFLPELRHRIFFLFIGGALLAAFVSIMTGLILEHIFHRKWWDYSKNRFQYEGYFGIWHLLIFGAAIVVMMKFANPLILQILKQIPHFIGRIILIIAYILMGIDFLGSVIAILQLKIKLRRIMQLNENMQKVSENVGNAITVRIQKRMLDKKMFGLFWHKVMNRKIPLVRGFDDVFLAPHSRHTEVPIADVHACKDLTVLAESDEAGLFLAMAEDGRKIFVMGHPEYDRVTLDGEYKRDLSKGLPIEMPKNYYRDNNPDNGPQLLWRAHANNLYTNWLNYYVYQATPYNLYGTPDFSGK